MVRSRMIRLLRAAALAVFAVLALATPVVHAQGPRMSATLDPTLATKLTKPGDLSLRNTPLAGALFTISELWQVNIVVGEDVTGQVNGAFQDAPLGEILDAILLSNGFSYRPVGQSLVVMKLSDLGDVNPLFETATIPIRGGEPADMEAAATLLSSPQGKVQAIASARSLLVVDFPDRVAMVRTLIGNLQGGATGDGGLDDAEQLEVAYFQPQYVPAKSMQDAMAAVLSKEGKIAVMEGEQRLVVLDYPSRLRLAGNVLQQVDQKRKQVRITAYIYDISDEDMHQLGFNWSHGLKGRVNGAGEPQSMFGLDSLAMVPFDAGTVGGAMTFMNLSRHFDLNAVIVALNTATDSRLLADPKVVVVDNEPAEISIVQEIPFQELTQTGQGGNIGTTAFKEAGVKLKVTPHIADDDTILLDIEPEFSRLTGFTPEGNQPIIDKRATKTQVRVVNGHTLVIGGLRQRTDVNEQDGIPFLMDLPHVGFLFRSRASSVRESELVVFIRPELELHDEPPRAREHAAAGESENLLDMIRAAQGCPLPNGTEITPALAEPLPDASATDGQQPELQMKITRLPATSRVQRAQSLVRLPRPEIQRADYQQASRQGAARGRTTKLPPRRLPTKSRSTPQPKRSNSWIDKLFRKS